jgi:hypothetical protein
MDVNLYQHCLVAKAYRQQEQLPVVVSSGCGGAPDVRHAAAKRVLLRLTTTAMWQLQQLLFDLHSLYNVLQ